MRTASTPTRRVATERLAIALIVTVVVVLIALGIVSSPVGICAQYESE
jgi:hypothetical protein